MKKRLQKGGSWCLAVCMILAGLAGCSDGRRETQNGALAESEIRYPMDTEESLTYWCKYSSADFGSNLGLTPFGEELQKKTGVKLTYIHPTVGSENEELNLMLASRDLPDIIEYQWISFAGGPEKAIKDGYIIDLTDVIAQEAPNYRNYLDQNPDIEKMVKTDGGKHYAFPFIRSTELLTVSKGPIIRKDWLDDLGLEVPETIEEWEVMLRRFRDEKGAQAPLSYEFSGGLGGKFLVGAYGIANGFYQENGSVKYGPIESGYKDFVTLMRRWYQEGLLDASFTNVDQASVESNILNGRTGATFGWGGQSIGTWMTHKKEGDSFDLVGATYPTLNKGEKPMFGQREGRYVANGAAAITTSCDNVPLAARFLDYGYSQEGCIVMNFGVENVSFKMVDGNPVYTDLITNNPDGKSIFQMLKGYICEGYGPYIQDERYLKQYYTLPQQWDAIKRWADTNTVLYDLPPITYNEEESEEFSEIMAEVTPYQSQTLREFILGAQPIEAFDDYVATIRSMGIARAIEIQQAALKRYYNR